MEEIRAWKEPNYPEGRWIDQERWQETGMDDVFDYARKKSGEVDDMDVPDAYSAIYTVNNLGSERIIPLMNQGDQIETVGGVFDSNPGYTQRYTSWDASFSEEELKEEVEAMDAKIIDMDVEHVESIERVTRDRVTGLYERITGFSDYMLF